MKGPLVGDLSRPCPETVTVPAGDIAVTELGVIPATEAKGLTGDRDTNVDPTHAGRDFVDDALSNVTAGGVDRRGVAVCRAGFKLDGGL